ncbi:lipase family protein [Nocardia crassostreae]|uniref:lipase family protein n=1 Tax=Nocardia crassostreae TaxID=53428 RepID=UPI000A5C08F5|nr:lipase family protein [Nocardia crassostreae]
MKYLTTAATTVVVGFSLTMGQTTALAEPPPVPPISLAPPAGLPQGPNPLQQWIDATIPKPTQTLPRVALPAPENVPADLMPLWHAVQSAPTGDPLFDVWPADLDRYAPGDILETRDVTATALPMLLVTTGTVIQRATLLKFRTTNSSGAPSIGTATLLLPAKPWTGAGGQPVLLNATAINALSRKCTTGYVLAHGLEVPTGQDFLPSPTLWAAEQGYAVVIPDHEGPLMSYAEPTVAGHTMLDSIRAVRNFAPERFGESRFASTGYSGGAIASYAGAVLAEEYAPELTPYLAGASLGGLTTDYQAFARAFDGSYASGFLLTIALAIAREHPEILGLMNHLAEWAATSPVKEICSGSFGGLGMVPVTFETVANIDKPLDRTIAADIFDRLSLSGRKSAIPLFVYHGLHDPWIPVAGAERLHREQCALGVAATKNIVGGEHLLAYLNSYTATMDWLDQRLRGAPATGNC